MGNNSAGSIFFLIARKIKSPPTTHIATCLIVTASIVSIKYSTVRIPPELSTNNIIHDETDFRQRFIARDFFNLNAKNAVRADHVRSVGRKISAPEIITAEREIRALR